MHRQLNNTDQPASVASLAGGTASQASVEIKGVCKSYGEEWEQQDVIKDLTLEYNKMRQASITTELLEIATAQMALGG